MQTGPVLAGVGSAVVSDDQVDPRSVLFRADANHSALEGGASGVAETDGVLYRDTATVLALAAIHGYTDVPEDTMVVGADQVLPQSEEVLNAMTLALPVSFNHAV